jgi:hypothetical protein
VSAEIILSSYGLLDKLSIDEYISEHEKLRDEKFRKVLPMRGALELVQHLVSRLEATRQSPYDLRDTLKVDSSRIVRITVLNYGSYTR